MGVLIAALRAWPPAGPRDPASASRRYLHMHRHRHTTKLLVGPFMDIERVMDIERDRLSDQVTCQHAQTCLHTHIYHDINHSPYLPAHEGGDISLTAGMTSRLILPLLHLWPILIPNIDISPYTTHRQPSTTYKHNRILRNIYMAHTSCMLCLNIP